MLIPCFLQNIKEVDFKLFPVYVLKKNKRISGKVTWDKVTILQETYYFENIT